MYFKLSIRNARRSCSDYLLYMLTVSILLAVMTVSHCVAAAGNFAGFQTASLPVLIVMILITLIYYMNDFMLKRRAKEFASYLLMGMDKRKLTKMFLYEFWMMGLCCFLAGTALGFGISGIFHIIGKCVGGMEYLVFRGSESGRALLHTFLDFCLMEGVCSFFIGHRMKKLTICGLLQEEKWNARLQEAGGCRKWGLFFLTNLICFLGGILGIVYLPEKTALSLLSVIAVPLLGSVFTGYRFLFAFLAWGRKKRIGFFYRKNRLYPMSWMLSNCRMDARLSAVFCICLLFSAFSFQFGVLLFQPGISLYGETIQRWMGFLQICLCIIFFVVCFSIRTLLILTEIRREAGNLKILYYMGKSGPQVKNILRRQAAVRLALPMGMAALLLLICTPLINWKLNHFLPDAAQNILLRTVGVFGLCTLFFYLLYFAVICRMEAG